MKYIKIGSLSDLLLWIFFKNVLAFVWNPILEQIQNKTARGETQSSDRSMAKLLGLCFRY